MRPRILIVEDNPANRELLSDWLEAEEFEVLAAENLAEAFAAVKNSEPHAILLDVQLGAEDGLELATWIRNDPHFRNTPVIAVTAHAMVTEQERMLRVGCNACVSKPIDFRALRQHLDDWIGQPAYIPPVPET